MGQIISKNSRPLIQNSLCLCLENGLRYRVKTKCIIKSVLFANYVEIFNVKFSTISLMNWGEKSGVVVIYKVSRCCTLDCMYKKKILNVFCRWIVNNVNLKYEKS